MSKGKVLVFVSSKQGCDELALNLQKHWAQGQFPCGCIHGDKDQGERSAILKKFKQGEVRHSAQLLVDQPPPEVPRA